MDNFESPFQYEFYWRFITLITILWIIMKNLQCSWFQCFYFYQILILTALDRNHDETSEKLYSWNDIQLSWEAERCKYVIMLCMYNNIELRQWWWVFNNFVHFLVPTGTAHSLSKMGTEKLSWLHGVWIKPKKVAKNVLQCVLWLKSSLS